MPSNQVMSKFASGTLKSGGSGKPVKNRKQAIAIKLSEEQAEAANGGVYPETLAPKKPKQLKPQPRHFIRRTK